ncbi:MAG TPA: PAS domain-containing protein, partial [Candidatus Polarisedimenticolia bacterium]|nr:PAS domain-containing protein [Candidatus Polarisedimenticolia bacterium]
MKNDDVLRFAEPLPEPTFLLTADGTILEANRAAEGQLGLSREEVRGRALADFIDDPQDEVARFLKTSARNTAVTPGRLNLK